MLVYITVLGSFALLIASVVLLPFFQASVKAICIVGLACLLIWYLIRNFALLMTMDLTLATLRCQMSARRRYYMHRIDQKRIERRIKRFGRAGKVQSILPKPELLRYRMQMSFTVYHRGIEKMILTYGAGELDEDSYRRILSSAKANVQAAKGSGKPLFVDKQQKNASYTTAALAVIFADTLNARLAERLPQLVTEQTGDGFDNCFLPLVLDFSSGICYFDGQRLPYIGYAYPCKNRAYRLAKKYVFGGRIPLRGNTEYLMSFGDVDPEMTLWAFWKRMKKEIVDSERENKRIFASLSDGRCLYKEEYLYIKIGNRGVVLAAEQSEGGTCVTVDTPVAWDFPKANAISKKDTARILQIAKEHFASSGHTVRFADPDND